MHEPKLANLVTRRLDRRRFVVTSLGAASGLLLSPAGGRALAQEGSEGTPRAGGRMVIGMIQEPGQLNDFFNAQSGSFISNLAVEPLFYPDSAGTYVPVLAAEVPTLENGGISGDFLTITYKLRDGITWSDGQPFSADDIRFTFEVLRNPESTPLVGSAHDLIEDVTVIDPLTVEVRMSAINPGYLDLFQQILPKHKFESSAVTQEHPQALIPLGTGPFVITEWKTGDEIILERNPSYREPGKPYLDGITIKITPEKEAAIASFINGDLDHIYFVVTGDLPTLRDAADRGVVLVEAEGGAAVEWLWLNLSTNGDPGVPHPVLGDPAIREAMDYGIDRQSIIDEILGGFGSLTGSFIFAGWAAVELPPTPYDPERARQLLDEAGWLVGGDGVREKDGVKASLRYQTIAGDLTRELYQQLVQQNMKDIGIELKIENVPSNTIFGSYEEGGILARGQYDILMSRDGDYVDPIEWVAVFTTDQITSAENPSGFTYSFLSNPEFDALAAEAAATLDQTVRKEKYQQLVTLFSQLRPALPLYRSAKATAFRDRIQGYDVDYFDIRGTIYGAENWYLSE